MQRCETNQDAAASFDWCVVLPLGLLRFSTVVMVTMRDRIAGIH